MKIALCLSGGLRNFKETFYTFEHFLLKKYDVDVFFYGLENKEGKNKNLQDLNHLYQPKNVVINDSSEYNNINCKYPSSSTFYAFYNIMKCNELKKQYQIENNIQYDIVIRSRTDYFWFRSFDDTELCLAKENILIPEEWAFKCVNSFAKSDVFAMGNTSLMDEYSNLYKNIDNYCKIFNYHPESLCGYHLMVNNIPVVETKRCVIFEYPSPRIEKYISPYKFIKYHEEPMIENEEEFLQNVSNRRKNF